MTIIKPDIIVHLASICSSVKCFNEPILSLQTNGMPTVDICNIIQTKGWKTKLINASSSEIYKGHVNYSVTENDTHMHHLHPYSIAKIMGHNMVEFYRTTYDLPFSNIVLFTIESPLKSREFLLNKVADHAHSWKNTNKPLELGNLSSYRNIIHSSDVAKAIDIIIKQDKGDNYVICNEESVQMINVVLDIYKASNINVYVNSDMSIVEIDTNNVVATTLLKREGDIISDIKGSSKKLKALGWKPQFTIQDIINDIVNKFQVLFKE
jgi:GDP-D-mannose dehydratase